MTRKTKIRLLTAAILMLTGCLLFGGVMSMLKWDFKKLSTVKYETNRHEINENFSNISVTVNTANITLVPSADSKTTVECYEQTNLTHTVKVEDGILKITDTDTRKWYEYIGIGFQTTKITVYLPAGEYGALSVKSDTGHTEIPSDFKFESIDISATTGSVRNMASATGSIKIKTSTGDIRMENITAEAVSLTASTGNINVSNASGEKDFHIKVNTGYTKLTDITCANLFSEGTTGDLLMTNVIASEKFSIRRNTGGITFVGCDAGEIFAKTDTGKIGGTLCSAKDFSSCKSDTGKIRVPQNGDGGRCELVTDTGNIIIEIAK